MIGESFKLNFLRKSGFLSWLLHLFMLCSLITFVPIGQISSKLTEASDLKNNFYGDQHKSRERDPEADLIRKNAV